MSTHHYKLFRLYGYPGFALILYLIMFLINPYERSLQSWKQYSVLDFAFDGLVNIGYAAVIFETGIQLTIRLNKSFPWGRNIWARFIVQLFLHISVISSVFILFFQIPFPNKFDYDQLSFRQAIVFGILFALLATVVFTTEHFFYKWNDARLEASELKTHAIQAQLTALKLQLDPHFLFNNLSTLASLIEENPPTAVRYVVNLSSIYRYMLANRVQDSVPIDTELAFIKAYSFLYQTRYGSGIRINIPDNPPPPNSDIAPLTLQLLVENAVKHNVFSIESPLVIDIYFSENRWIVVRNRHTPKTVKEPGSHMGLKNIRERYELLGNITPVITEKSGFFEVRIPILPHQDSSHPEYKTNV